MKSKCLNSIRTTQWLKRAGVTGLALLTFGATTAFGNAQKGKDLFSNKGCIGCHTFGEGDRSGPDLKGVFSRRDETWIRNWIKDPNSAFAAGDPTAQELLKKFNVKMPALGLSDQELDDVLAYVKEASGGGHFEGKSNESKSNEGKSNEGKSNEGKSNADSQEKVATGDSSDNSSLLGRMKNWWAKHFSSGESVSLDGLAKSRGLTPEDMIAAIKTYTPSGKHDPYIMFASGGHSGGVLVIGVPSMRIIKTIPVFTPDSWQGYGVGSVGSENLLDSAKTLDGKKLRWGDVHHPALSQTNASYDGQFLFVNDKANARIAVIDLQDFTTKQIVKNPLFINDHGGAFVTPNTDYVIETSQYNVPLPNHYEPISQYHDKYRGVATFWKFDRTKGRIDREKSFSMELPPYWQDLTSAGKKVSDGYCFFNSFNTEEATGGNLEGKPNIEIGASKNDMDYLHIVNWKKAAQIADLPSIHKINGMRVIPLSVSIQEGIVYLAGEPKSPHGVDVTPDGSYAVVSGKLDPHTTIYSFSKIQNAIAQKIFEGKDRYGIPILKFDAVVEAQVEVGLGPLHTQFDSDGYAYTSLFLDSAIAKWTLGPPWHTGKDAWRLVDKVSVQYNIGHLSCIQGDTATPGKGYCVALNKWALDRYPDVGPLLPQNFQLVDTSGEKMKVIYDLPIPNAEPHYVQIVDAKVLHPISVYPMGTDPLTMKKSADFTPAGSERIEHHGKNVDVFMTLIRSHITPDHIEVNKGDHVVLHISSVEGAKDATHGFAISGYNVNLSMEPGKVERVEFVADQAGVFPYYCTEFCSALHLEMTGYFLVKP